MIKKNYITCRYCGLFYNKISKARHERSKHCTSAKYIIYDRFEFKDVDNIEENNKFEINYITNNNNNVEHK